MKPVSSGAEAVSGVVNDAGAGAPVAARESTRRRPLALWLGAASIGFSLALRVLYLAQPWRIDLSEHPVFGADEGIVGLMGRHILQGARPLFYYGQYYMGALEAYVAAASFRLFGASMTTLRVVPTVFSILWIPLTWAIARRLYGRRAAWLATALVAVPSQFVFEWGFKARGGYAEHVTLVLVILYAAVLLLDRVTTVRLAVLGLAAGLSLWVNQLAIAYVPFYAFALWQWMPLRRRQLAVLLIAGVLGAGPLIYANIVVPLGTVRALGVEVRSSMRLQARHAADDDEEKDYRAIPLFQVLGAQPRRDGAWSAFGIAAALLLCLGLGAGTIRLLRLRGSPARFRGQVLLLGFTAASVASGASGFSGQPVGRYQLLLYPLLAVLTGGWLAPWGTAGTAVVAAVALGQTVQLAAPVPTDGRTPRDAVVEALLQQNLHFGYGAGFMDDVVFQSGERVIIVPIERPRYPAYEPLVAAADNVFYIYRDDQADKTAHRMLMEYLADNRVHYRETTLGEYHILSQIEPREAVSGAAMAQLRERIHDRKHPPAKKAAS